MSQAYDVATREFIKLRAVGEIANFAAEEELLAYGESEKSLPSRKAFVSFLIRSRRYHYCWCSILGLYGSGPFL